MRVNIENATKRYGIRPVVDGVSLSITSGELFVLLGPSGSGKSTLLGAIAGLVTLDSGRITLGDRVANDPQVRIDPSERGVGMVFQELALWPHMTVRKHLQFVAPDSDPAEVLDPLEISHLAEARPGTLSGGEAQRLAIARALITRPSIFLLDEPLGPLDRRLKGKMLDLIQKVHAEFGTTTIHVTHDYEEAFRLGDRVGILVEGHVAQVGSPDEIYNRPATREAAELSGPVTWLQGTANGASVKSALGEHTAAEGCIVTGAVRVALRPEAVSMIPSEAGHDVLACFGSGPDWVVRVQVGQDRIEGRCEQKVEAGSKVRVQLPPSVWACV